MLVRRQKVIQVTEIALLNNARHLAGFERIERNGESNEVVLYDRREKVKA